VALANTNHWMRGGTYGWQAAELGSIALCWTNTLPNLPPWGATAPALGNNPLVLAVPRPAGHVVLDIAMSQFSYGALDSYRRRGEMLPVEGGYDSSGKLSRDAGEIEATRRLLPIGYWKGSGLALLLDLVAAMVSGGKSTHEIPANPERESGLSQVFVAFDARGREEIANAVIDNLRVVTDGDKIRYPGERVIAARREKRQHGVPVDEQIWREILADA
jgi:3-dehydro-L-gulonate 2-dehydrogenase